VSGFEEEGKSKASFLQDREGETSGRIKEPLARGEKVNHCQRGREYDPGGQKAPEQITKSSTTTRTKGVGERSVRKGNGSHLVRGSFLGQ